MGDNFKLTEYEETFANFKIKLKVFETLKGGDKIIKEPTTGILFSDPPTNWQWLKRWWYGESKANTFIYLDNLFIEFMKFLDIILVHQIDNNKTFELKQLCKEICQYIDLIIPGLCSLNCTYNNSKKIKCKVASIVVTLIDFKREIRPKLNRKTIRRSQTP